MKKLIYLVAVLLTGTALTTIVSCSENNDWTHSWYLAQLLNNGGKTHEDPKDPDDPTDTTSGDIVSFAHSGCKSTAATRGDDDTHVVFPTESVKYEGTEDGYLLLEHINAIFSCEATFTIKATVADGIITIVETAPSLTNCLCPYDLSMKIGPLENKTYEVVICDQTEDTKRVSFLLDYSSSVKGEFEVSRHFPSVYTTELVEKGDLPEWLVAIVDGYMDNFPAAIYQGIWNDETVYYYYNSIHSCMFCTVYHADGTPMDWDKEDCTDFINSSKDWKCIYMFKH